MCRCDRYEKASAWQSCGDACFVHDGGFSVAVGIMFAMGFFVTNIGPSLVTRGGVVFIGAATDERFHAYDTKTGKLLWQTRMSTSSNAGPMTYVGKDGRQ